MRRWWFDVGTRGTHYRLRNVVDFVAAALLFGRAAFGSDKGVARMRSGREIPTTKVTAQKRFLIDTGDE